MNAPDTDQETLAEKVLEVKLALSKLHRLRVVQQTSGPSWLWRCGDWRANRNRHTLGPKVGTCTFHAWATYPTSYTNIEIRTSSHQELLVKARAVLNRLSGTPRRRLEDGERSPVQEAQHVVQDIRWKGQPANFHCGSGFHCPATVRRHQTMTTLPLQQASRRLSVVAQNEHVDRVLGWSSRSEAECDV